MSGSIDERGPVELLADEFLARCKRGEKPTIKEYCDRHPDLAEEIRDVFEAVLMVEDLRPGSSDVSGSVGESLHVNGKRLEQVGDYRILCEIGRGGMGVVYEAEQQALGRRVALKVLPRAAAGNSSAQVRFQREAKAAARMHHTNIVPVFDVGQDGEHLYYAMQLIHGQGLDLVIDDLKRLRAQSTAVPAKGKTIAASLVTGQFEQENLAAPNPIDSGATAAFEGSAPSSAMLPGQSEITTATTNRGAYFRSVAQIGLQTASALSYAHSRGIIHRDIKPGNLILDTTGNVWVTDFGLAKTGDGAMTHTGDILGTVRYMSPERFRGHCDVRADVYALGMTLYELLTLKAAYASGDRLKLIEMIRQEEAASPRSVDARIPRDLETIVMKAIDKDPKRRYQSADEMGEDLQRFVNDEPIKARRVGQVERFTRWCRRRPAVAGLLAAVLLLMAAGTAVSTWQAVVATRAREDLAKKHAELEAEQAKVQARFDLAVKAIETFHTGVSEDTLLKNPEFKELRTKLLKEAAGFYADLEKLLAGKTDAKSRKLLADGYFQLGELTAKIGDQKEALAVQRTALALRRELAAAPGAGVETRLDVARSLRAVGRLLDSTGDLAGALSAFEEQRDLAAALEAEAPTDAVREQLAKGHNSIGLVLSETGKPAEAMQEYQKALAIRQKLADANPAVTDFQSDLAASYNNLGALLNDYLSKHAEALAAFRQSLAIQQKLADANPAVTDFQSHLAWSHNNIGIVLYQTGKPAEALQENQKALAIRQKLADANPAVTQFQSDVATSHGRIGAVLSETGKPAEALKEYPKALAIFQKLADANPAVTQFQSMLAASHNDIGIVLRVTGKPAEALQEYQKALAIQQKLADANPTVTQFQTFLANHHANIGAVLSETGKSAEALQEFQKALAIRQKLADANPGATAFQSDLAGSHNEVGDVMSETGKPAEALKEFQQARAILQKLADANPAVTELQGVLAGSHHNIGRLLSEAGKPAEALLEYQQALAIRQKLADANPSVIDFQLSLATSHNYIGRLHAREKRFTEAFAALDRGLAIRQKLADAHPTIPLFTNHLGWGHAFRGWAHVRAGHPALAAADLRRALVLWEKGKAADSQTRFERARALALLAGLAADGKSGVSAAEAAAFADQAALALRDSAQAGWGNWAELKEPDFDPLRGRDDFRKLLAEAEAKAGKQ
jgi:serine/threonine-protein kinase